MGETKSLEDQLRTLNKQSIVNKLKSYNISPREKAVTIPAVPGHIQQKNDAIFKPTQVHIGPYHCKKERDNELEVKWQSVNRLNDHVDEGMIELIRDGLGSWYPQASIGGDVAGFVARLLVDGCFILQYFQEQSGDNSGNVLIGDLGWSRAVLKRDLLLVQNQIPFKVVEKLNELLPANSDRDRRALITRIVGQLKPPGQTWVVQEPPQEVHHLLQLYHECLVRCRCISHDGVVHQLIDSATELQAECVKFKPKKKPRSMFDVTFNRRNGVMEIPPLVLDEDARTLFTNLLVFEQCWYVERQTATSFVRLMCCLLKKPGDADILKKNGIVKSQLRWGGEPMEPMEFFWSIYEFGELRDEGHCFTKLFGDVDWYSKQPCNQWRKYLKLDFFNNPWAIFTFIGSAKTNVQFLVELLKLLIASSPKLLIAQY